MSVATSWSAHTYSIEESRFSNSLWVKAINTSVLCPCDISSQFTKSRKDTWEHTMPILQRLRKQMSVNIHNLHRFSVVEKPAIALLLPSVPWRNQAYRFTSLVFLGWGVVMVSRWL